MDAVLRHSFTTRLPMLIVVLALVVGEALWRRFVLRCGYDMKAALASFAVAAGHVITGVANAAVIGGALTLFWRLTPFRLPADDWRTWTVGFFAVELAYYWFHRWSHTVRWLWASHAVHHSPQELTLPAALRLGWTGALSGGWLVFVPLVLVGFHPALIAVLLAFNLQYQFLLHTEVVGRLGVLEWVLNTPSHHRVHHAMNPSCLDRNYGGVLIVFDRWFGTFGEMPCDEPLRYGLVGGRPTLNPLSIALSEWGLMMRDFRKRPTVMSRFRALLAMPTVGGMRENPEQVGGLTRGDS